MLLYPGLTNSTAECVMVIGYNKYSVALSGSPRFRIGKRGAGASLIALGLSLLRSPQPRVLAIRVLGEQLRVRALLDHPS